jgi:serine/threonine-protein kinase
MSSDLQPGSQLAEYRIERLVGRGGMGVVYQAEHVHLGKRVALKVLPPEYMKDSSFRERFELEARLAASLEHPNIVPVTDAGEFQGELWIAMRFVDGTDLREVLHAHGALNPIRAVSILGRVASALDTAHAAGLVHRDVKPGNILLEPPSPTRQVEHVYLTDFGLTKQVDAAADDVAGQFAAQDAPKAHGDEAEGPDHGPMGPDHGPLGPEGEDGDGGSVPDRQLTRAGYFAGTVDYAAPEQFRGEPLDGRVDVYALGCVMYECLTGSAPFTGEDERHVMLMHLQSPPPKASAVQPGIPRGIDAVIARAMAKDREARFATCREMVDAARSFLAGWDPSSATVSMPAAPGPPPGSLAGTPSGSFPSASSGSIPSAPSGSFPGTPPAPPVSSGVQPAASTSAPSGTSQPSDPSAGGASSGSQPGALSTTAASIPPVPAAATSGVTPPPAPVPPAADRASLASRNPLLTWILVGAGAAIVVVLLLILLSR